MSFAFDHIAINVTDLERSCTFYKDLLGAAVVSRPSHKFIELVVGERAGRYLRIHLVHVPHHQAGQGTIDHLCLNVSSSAELDRIAHLVGATIVESEPMGLKEGSHSEERPPVRVVYFKDPDGAKIEVRQY